MTTPIACQTCVFWEKFRQQSCNWGRCKITNDFSNPKGAYVTPDGAELCTIETFYCSNYQLQEPPKRYSVVDAAREAATKIGKEIK